MMNLILIYLIQKLIKVKFLINNKQIYGSLSNKLAEDLKVDDTYLEVRKVLRKIIEDSCLNIFEFPENLICVANNNKTNESNKILYDTLLNALINKLNFSNDADKK